MGGGGATGALAPLTGSRDPCSVLIKDLKQSEFTVLLYSNSLFV